jgi:hypothetical protein
MRLVTYPRPQHFIHFRMSTDHCGPTLCSAVALPGEGCSRNIGSSTSQGGTSSGHRHRGVSKRARARMVGGTEVDSVVGAEHALGGVGATEVVRCWEMSNGSQPTLTFTS